MERPSPPYVMGIDVGTQSLRARVFDLAGFPVAAADRPLATTYRHPGWAEQHPDEWWRALAEVVLLSDMVDNSVGARSSSSGLVPHVPNPARRRSILA